MLELYDVITGIFEKSSGAMTIGMYGAGKTIFDNMFFKSCFTIFLAFLSFMIMFKRFSSEELAYRFIWFALVIVTVEAFLWDQSIYKLLIDILDFPRRTFTELISRITVSVSEEASIRSIIMNLSISSETLIDTVFDNASWKNPIAYIYGFVLWLASSFLMIVILLNTVFSTFLAQVILSLATLIVPFLIFKRTEYIFFGWVKLYISVSLYPPFTVLFGLIANETAQLTISGAKVIIDDFEGNIEYVLALILLQLLTALAIFKIPNIVNQLIGSSNEGSSLTSGVGTISAGTTIMHGLSKFSGARFATNASQWGAKKASDKIKSFAGESLDKQKQAEVR